MALAIIEASPAVASLRVHPTSYSLQVDRGRILTTPLHITNAGPVSVLGFTVSDDRDWLSEYPTSGQIAIGDTVEVTVTADATNLDQGTYTGTITVVDPHHGPIYIPVTLEVQGTAGLEDAAARTGQLLLGHSVPNPMIDAAEIRWLAPRGSFARLAVLDVSGREVAVLFAGTVPQEENSARWDGLDGALKPVPSGAYLYVLESGGRRVVRRLVRIR